MPEGGVRQVLVFSTENVKATQNNIAANHIMFKYNVIKHRIPLHKLYTRIGTRDSYLCRLRAVFLYSYPNMALTLDTTADFGGGIWKKLTDVYSHTVPP